MENKIESLEGEEWRDVAGFEGWYMVSSCGRIKRIVSKTGKHKTERLLRASPNGRGYPSVQLFSKDNYGQFRVHRLVCAAFIPFMDGKNVVNHKNMNRADNRVENLEWCTQSENLKHGFRVTGRRGSGFELIGSRCHSAIEVCQIDLRGAVIASFYGAAEAGRFTGISSNNIRRCARGELITCGGFKWKYKKDMQ